MIEIFSAMNTCFATWIMSSREKAEVRARVLASISSQGESTIKSLLVAFCDAMVQITGACIITGDATKLSAMLMRQPLSGSMKGSSLLALVHPDDQPRLSASLERTGPTEPTGTLAVRLLDARNFVVPVQLYY